MRWAKDSAQLKPVVTVLGMDETLARLERFFASTNSWIKGTDYGVGAFVVSVNRLTDVNGTGANGTQRRNGHEASPAPKPAPRGCPAVACTMCEIVNCVCAECQAIASRARQTISRLGVPVPVAVG